MGSASQGKGTSVSQTFNVNGINARINIGSTDNSTNVVHVIAQFSEARKAIEAGISDSIERAEILKRLDKLEQATDRKSASESYEAFITAAASHMTLIAPFLPALANWVRCLIGNVI